MTSLKSRPFNQPLVLMSLERGLLDSFLDRFRAESAARGTPLPAASLPDEEFFAALARRVGLPDGLPDSLLEALDAISAMATEEGRERVYRASVDAGITIREDASDFDCAMHAWMQAPEVFNLKFGELKSLRLTAFDYYGAVKPVDRSRTFMSPSEQTLASLTTNIDAWYARRGKGVGNTLIEVYPINGEFYFVIRHGASYARLATIDQHVRRALHFRPDKDELVAYCPILDELRVCAKSVGEKHLFREVFGYCLFGDNKHFSDEMTYSLAPLQELGERVLDHAGLPGVRRITLTEAEYSLDASGSDVMIHKGKNLFAWARERAAPGPLFPEGCSVKRVIVDFVFAAVSKPCRVQVRPPNGVKVPRGADLTVIHRWLSLGHLRIVASPTGSKE